MGDSLQSTVQYVVSRFDFRQIVEDFTLTSGFASFLSHTLMCILLPNDVNVGQSGFTNSNDTKGYG
jgi:hypothetical protein